MAKVIGFTGTQKGMSSAQKNELGAILEREWGADHQLQFHHGDCIGADEEAHEIAIQVSCSVVIHPPIIENKRAHCYGPKTTHLPPKSYLERNHDIVDSSEYLIAAPKNPRQEELRSGTWATIRYARKLGKKVVILNLS